MIHEILKILDTTDLQELDKQRITTDLLRLFNVSSCRCKEPVKCRNCDEMVVMVSKGEFCPSCYC